MLTSESSPLPSGVREHFVFCDPKLLAFPNSEGGAGAGSGAGSGSGSGAGAALQVASLAAGSESKPASSKCKKRSTPPPASVGEAPAEPAAKRHKAEPARGAGAGRVQRKGTGAASASWYAIILEAFVSSRMSMCSHVVWLTMLTTVVSCCLPDLPRQSYLPARADAIPLPGKHTSYQSDFLTFS